MHPMDAVTGTSVGVACASEKHWHVQVMPSLVTRLLQASRGR